MTVFNHPDFDNHEQVMFCRDADAGLTAIIAIHSTALGPAAGGCRMYPYASADDALADVLRLSRGMSYKNAMAGLPLGGGKCVIIADPTKPEKPGLLRAFGRHVQSLGGRYWTAIDVGVSPEDIDVLGETCEYVFCQASAYPDGFNPSLFTALGGFTAIKAVAAHLWANDDLTGRRVAIQGCGATGADLARRLHDAGAELILADVNDIAVQKVVEAYGARAVDPAVIHAQEVDIFAPCALGAILNDASIPELKAKAICGLANNQLAEARHGAALRDRGIVYAPDYIVNGGGVTGAAARIFSNPTMEQSEARILEIYGTLKEVLAKAAAKGAPTSEVADDLARERIAAAR